MGEGEKELSLVSEGCGEAGFGVGGQGGQGGQGLGRLYIEWFFGKVKKSVGFYMGINPDLPDHPDHPVFIQSHSRFSRLE